MSNSTRYDMCPQCGRLVECRGQSLIPLHLEKSTGDTCPGSQQTPRNPESDFRFLWNGKMNPHAIKRPTN